MMNIEVGIFLTNPDLEIKAIVEKDRIEIIVIENANLAVRILEEGIDFFYRKNNI